MKALTESLATFVHCVDSLLRRAIGAVLFAASTALVMLAMMLCLVGVLIYPDDEDRDHGRH